MDDLETARRQILDYVKAGCTWLVIGPRPPLPTARRLAEELIEPVLEAAS
jgi:hypothetical protein